MPEPQTYANHRKYVPLYHGLTFILLVLYLAWAIRGVFRQPSLDQAMTVVLAVALILTAFFARVFALKAQDRVIRLEERLRLGRLLPDDLKPRIEELTGAQLVALRFASDAELADLTRRVLSEKITNQDAIKRMIKGWRADHFRA